MKETERTPLDDVNDAFAFYDKEMTALSKILTTHEQKELLAHVNIACEGIVSALSIRNASILHYEMQTYGLLPEDGKIIKITK